VKTIKRQTRAAYGCMAVGQSPLARVWTALRLYACSVCDTQCHFSCCMRLVAQYKCYAFAVDTIYLCRSKQFGYLIPGENDCLYTVCAWPFNEV